MNGTLPFSGRLTARKIKARGAPLLWRLRNYSRPAFIRTWLAVFVIAPLARLFGLMTAYGTLRAVVYRFRSEGERAAWAAAERRLAAALAQPALVAAHPDLIRRLQGEVAAYLAGRERVDYGVLGYRVVTTAFVTFVVDNLQADSTEVGDFKYHDSGVGTTAEAAGDTGIETTDGESRVAGTQTETAANVYSSVATISYTTTKAITEHGLFSQSVAGTLMDRTVFAALNMVNGDSTQFTYSLTLTAGS